MIERGRKGGIEVQQFLDLSFLEAKQRSLFDSAGRGGSGLGLEESEFSEDFTEARGGEMVLLAVLARVIESDASGRNHEQFAPGIPLLKDRFPARKVQFRGELQQVIQVFIRESAEEGNQLVLFSIHGYNSIIARCG